MEHVKILFEHFNTPESDYGIESAWAVPFGKNFKLDNILFYAPEYSLGDIVSVEVRNGEYYVTGLVQESGHSTVRIIFSKQEILNQVRLQLKELGCDSEISDVPVLISVDIPPEVDYAVVKRFLEEGEAQSKWSYEEACIAH